MNNHCYIRNIMLSYKSDNLNIPNNVSDTFGSQNFWNRLILF
jgi:hypothetical protein